MEEEKRKPLQWHPAFFAGIQIEFREEMDKLIFENEHHLGTKPKVIDVLVIRKTGAGAIRKNIGRIFRGHNIIEYKSPEDYVSIDTYYKVYGYTCFYKSDTDRADSITIQDVTITLVSHGYPRKLMKHLKKRGLVIERKDAGIYYVVGESVPVQILVTKRLGAEENLWLRSLSNELDDADARRVYEEYTKHQNENLYSSVMDVVMRANIGRYGEEEMCKAMEEILEPRIRAREERSRAVGHAEKLRELIRKKLTKGQPVEIIADALEESPEVIRQMIEEMDMVGV